MLTITEALSEIKIAQDRLQKKMDFVSKNLIRTTPSDPMEASGGTGKVISQEMQAITDLEERIVRLRAAIARSNLETTVIINGKELSITEWLALKKDVVPAEDNFLRLLSKTLNSYQAKSENKDIVFNIDAANINKEYDAFLELTGKVDAALSVKNATTFIDL